MASVVIEFVDAGATIREVVATAEALEARLIVLAGQGVRADVYKEGSEQYALRYGGVDLVGGEYVHWFDPDLFVG